MVPRHTQGTSVASDMDDTDTVDIMAFDKDNTGTVDTVASGIEDTATVDTVTSDKDDTGTVDTVASNMDDTGTVDKVVSDMNDTGTVDTVASRDDMAVVLARIVHLVTVERVSRLRPIPSRFVRPFHLLVFSMKLCPAWA